MIYRGFTLLNCTYYVMYWNSYNIYLNKTIITTLVCFAFLTEICLYWELQWSVFLLQTLSSELSKSKQSKDAPKVLKVLLVYLMKRTSSDKNFVKAIVSHTNIACPLFRLLTSISREDLLSTVLLIARVVLSEAQKAPQAKPLVGILKSFIKSHGNKNLSSPKASSFIVSTSLSSENPNKGKFESIYLNKSRNVSQNIVCSRPMQIYNLDSTDKN